jgi:hypothetical protein
MNRKRALFAAAVAAAAIAGWFLAVDFSWFEEICPACLESRTVLQYRVCGRAVHEDLQVRPSVIQRASVDLGVPCSHPAVERWHKHRWWGLVVCRCPCINGTVGLVGDPTWYDRNAASKLKALRVVRPELSAEFQQRVLVDHDREFWRALLEEITSCEPGT